MADPLVSRWLPLHTGSITPRLPTTQLPQSCTPYLALGLSLALLCSITSLNFYPSMHLAIHPSPAALRHQMAPRQLAVPSIPRRSISNVGHMPKIPPKHAPIQIQHQPVPLASMAKPSLQWVGLLIFLIAAAKAMEAGFRALSRLSQKAPEGLLPPTMMMTSCFAEFPLQRPTSRSIMGRRRKSLRQCSTASSDYPAPFAVNSSTAGLAFVLHVNGSDSQQALPTTLKLLADHGLHIREISHTAVHGQVHLTAMLQSSSSSFDMDLLLRQIHAIGLHATAATVTAEDEKEYFTSLTEPDWIVTVIGEQLSITYLAAITSLLMEHQMRVCSIRCLSGPHPPVPTEPCPLSAVELRLRGPVRDVQAVRQDLAALCTHLPVDVSFQRDDIYRGHRQLAVFDMDSTLIQAEVIDELAKVAGVGEQVAAITAAAMRGEIDFQESLKLRVSNLRGLPEKVLQDVADRLPLTKGTEKLIQALHAMGYKTAILSGGFTYFARKLQAQLGFDYVYANELEIIDGVLTGQVVGDVITAERKAELMKEIADREGISPHQVIAVGDGANDLLMLAQAGLGIAFHAKPLVRAKAEQQISNVGLDGLLYLLGVPDRHVTFLSNETHKESQPVMTMLAIGGDVDEEEQVGVEVRPKGTVGYQGTSGFVKVLVSALTDAVNAVVESVVKPESPPSSEDCESILKAQLTPQELLDAIRLDYVERNYLWTGDIQPEIYEDDCRWTDPTLSFEGLATFQRNIRNLKPIVDRFVPSNGTDLLDIELLEEENQVRTRWRMRGNLNLPWKPCINVVGRTHFTYDPAAGNRIKRYDEFWEISAAEALLQITTPTSNGPKEADP